MSQVKELLIDQLKDLLHAEGQLVGALPKMADAANNPKLKEGFDKHLIQTQGKSSALKRSLRSSEKKQKRNPARQ